MNADDVVDLLRKRCEEAGSMCAFSRLKRMNPGVVWMVLHSERKPTPQVLLALGVRKVISYEPIKNEDDQ